MTQPIPKGFPASTVHLQTALALVSQQSPEKLVSIAEKLYEIFWANGDATIIASEKFLPVFESELNSDVAQKILSEVSLDPLPNVWSNSYFDFLNSQHGPMPRLFWMKIHGRLLIPELLVYRGLNAPMPREKRRYIGVLITLVVWPTVCAWIRTWMSHSRCCFEKGWVVVGCGWLLDTVITR